MNVLICGFVLFGTAFLLHAGLWRIKRPANTIKALVALFGMVLISGLITLLWLGRIYPDTLILPHELINYIYTVIIFLSLFMTYLLSYPAIEADSPSLVIISHISGSGSRGILAAKIKELLRDDLLIEPRLKDLVDSGMVDLTGSVYKINKKGILFLRPFMAYRRFLKLGKGG